MAQVAELSTPRQLGEQVWRPRTRRLLLPAVGLGVWISYTTWVLPSSATGLWGNLRWLLLAALAVQGLLEIWRWGGQTPMAAPTLAFLGFSLATFASISYSIIPSLSFYKAVSFLLALIALVFGLGLRCRGNPGAWLHLLAVANLAVVSTALLTLPIPDSFHGELFRGLFNNPNSLGTALALTLPALLWLRERYLRGSLPNASRLLLMAAVISNVAVIFLSRSRSSLVAVSFVLLLYMFLRASRLVSMIVYGMLVLLLAAPAVASQVGRDAAFKGQEGQTTFDTRIQQFDATLEAALAQPISGYGFGTSAGVTEWDGSLSVADISREKANAYIGLVEEVGLVGAIPLMLGLAGVIIIGFRLARRAKTTADGTPAALLALVVAGVVNANFEGWLTSIGSFHGFIFWGSVGVLLMNYQRISPSPIDDDSWR